MSTKISWTDESWNPITGCTKISPGCKNCYAERTARRLAGQHGYPEAPHHFGVTLRYGRLEQPLRWRKPRMVFVCSMGDLFHEDVPWELILQVYKTIKRSPQHTYQILTKRPKRMLALQPHIWGELPNAWFGVSVENPDYLWRIEELLKMPAIVRFVSVEPMLEPIDLVASIFRPGIWDRIHPDHDFVLAASLFNSGLNWIIVGAESGPARRPFDPAWALDVYEQCQRAGVPFFGKQDSGLRPGVPLLLGGREVKEWPL